MKNIIKENIIKHIILAVLLIALFFPIQSFLINNLSADKESAGDIIVVMSIIAVTACFGNFAFTYEKINSKKKLHRYIAHITTGLLMLIIGISLIFSANLTIIIMGSFIISDLSFLLLYIACVFYDFWDLFKLEL